MQAQVTRMRLIAYAIVCAMLLGAGAASAADVPRDPEQFGFEHTETGRIGSSHAGAHPTVYTKFTFKTGRIDDGGWNWLAPHGTPERVSVDMPYGLVGNPMAVPKCKRADFIAIRCPPQTQVGIANPWPSGFDAPFPDRPIYALESDGTSPALLGIDVLGLALNFAYLRIHVRPDGGLRTVTDPLPRGTPLIENKLTLWGVPADENLCNPNHPQFDPDAVSPYGLGTKCPVTHPDDWERKPFMTSPTDCELVPFSVLRTTSYEGKSNTNTVSQPHPPEHCEDLVFEPSIDVNPTNPAPDGVSGLSVDINIPQNDDPDGYATPHLRAVRMTLPEGVSINPGAATDLQACADSAFGKGQEGAATCSAASKVGHLSITTPLLEAPLPGDIHIGEPLPGNRYRIFLYAEGQGVKIKLTGSLRPDPATGQITALFDDNPPLPFSNLHLEFRGGPRGVLAMPQTCGTKTVTAALTPYSGQPAAQLSDTFEVNGACHAALPFAPAFTGGSLPATAGSYAPFAVSFIKPDGHQALSGIEVDLPPGLLAKVRDVPLCSDADAAAGTCPAETRVGTVRAGAGPGASPLFLPGTASLTGPYKNAPYGLAIAVPAVAGPYDLGMVVVRQRVIVDPVDAHLRVVSDPLPTILEGVPLRIQRIDVNMDRPGFMTTPTSCAPKQLKASLTSTGGAAAPLTQHYQVAGCKKLAFKPKMAMRLVGERQLTDGKHPGLAVSVTQPEGGANMRQVKVKLPLSLALDPENAETLCEYEDGLAVRCPASSIIGKATAVSPLLKRPLSGPVYFVKGVRFNKAGQRVRTLPTLLVTLRGEIGIDLRARSDVQRGRLVNTFELVPDAPLSRFDLRLDGGSGGILAATTRICGKRQVARVETDGQNGKRRDFGARIATPCAKKASR